jgi:hypothetical protein
MDYLAAVQFVAVAGQTFHLLHIVISASCSKLWLKRLDLHVATQIPVYSYIHLFALWDIETVLTLPTFKNKCLGLLLCFWN